MKECFAYVRVSTVKQGEGVSLEAQREAISAFADRNSITITRWFEEKLTAAKSGRPVFGAMLKALKARKADGVVMHKIDRSARNFTDWAKIGDLADAGIDVHFATESLDFRSRGGRLAADIQAVVAADYIRNLRDETIKGISGRLKQGLYPFGAPVGYLDNGGGKPKTFDPFRAPLVRLAFELYASGRHSLRSLVAEMDRRGLRSRGGKPLTKHGIEVMLGNPFYCGIIRSPLGGAVYRGVHEPMVDPAVFERVQEVRAGKAGKKVTRHNHTYRGLFRCGLCAAAMTPERQKGHVYYRCQTPTCATTTVREEAIEDAVAATLARAKLTDQNAARLVTSVTEWSAARAKQDGATTLKMQLALIDSRLDRLTDALVDGVIDQSAFSQRKETLLRERIRLERAEAENSDRQSEPERVKDFLELVKSVVSTYEIAVREEKRRITEIATSNRTVTLKNVDLRPANWLLVVSDVLTVPDGDPHCPTSRTDAFERLIAAARSVDVKAFTTRPGCAQ